MIELKIIKSSCRSHYHKEGDVFQVNDVCPPICMELWHGIYPYVMTLKNGGSLDFGDSKAKRFKYTCPDQGRVVIEGYIKE